MAAALWSALPGLLAVLTATSVLSETMNVPSGWNISDCCLRCPRTHGYLALHRECGEQDSRLVGLSCYHLLYTNLYGPRLHVDNGSGRWTLTDAGTNDSCLYYILYYGNGRKVLRIFSVTVLDPGASPPTSSPGGNSSSSPRTPKALSPGEPYSLELRFFLLPLIIPVGTCIFCLVKRLISCLTKKPEEVEMPVMNNNIGEHGRPTSCASATDRLGDQRAEAQKRNLLAWIWKIWKNPEHEQTSRRDEEAALTAGIQVTATEQRRL